MNLCECVDTLFCIVFLLYVGLDTLIVQFPHQYGCFTGDKLYWSNYDYTNDYNSLEVANTDGTNSQDVLQNNAVLTQNPREIAVYYNNIYFVDSNTGGGALYRMPKDGSSIPVAVGLGTTQFVGPEGLHIEYSKSHNPIISFYSEYSKYCNPLVSLFIVNIVSIVIL